MLRHIPGRTPTHAQIDCGALHNSGSAEKCEALCGKTDSQ